MKLMMKLERFDDIVDRIYNNPETSVSLEEDELSEEGKWEIAVDNAQFELDWMLEDLYHMLDNEVFILVDGSAGLWNGDHYYDIQVAGTIEDIIRKISSGCEDLELEVYKKYKGYYIEGRGFHHDGTNYYEFVTLDALNKKELVNTFSSLVDLKPSWSRAKIIEKIEESL